MTAAGAQPTFSVVVPTFQRREVVCDMVRAAFTLEYRGNLEMIVVVDGSTDGTAEALMFLDCPFPLQLIEQANAGPAAARNAGARAASGDILLFLDDDMMCERDLLMEHARSYREGADAVIGDFLPDKHSAPGFLAEGSADWVQSARGQARSGDEVRGFDLFSGQFSVRRGVFTALGGFDESLTRSGHFAGEDTDFGVRLSRQHKIVFNGRALTRHRYVVSPREWMERAFCAGRGGAAFARKHPELLNDFFLDMSSSRWKIEAVYRPLGRVPVLPRLLAWIAGWVGQAALHTPLRSHRLVSRGFYFARQVAYWSAFDRAAPLALGGSAIVLSYHSISDRSRDPVLAPYSVPPALFRSHLESLAQRGYTFISGDDLADFLVGKKALPRKAVLLTFDDCYRDLARVVEDILKPRGIPALAFCVTGVESNSNEWDEPLGAERVPLLTWAELAGLRADGIETGSHSRTHRRLPALPDAEIVDEIDRSAEELEQAGFPRPRFFAYPYGLHDRRVRDCVRRAGYVGAFGIGTGRANRFWDRFDLPRVRVMAYDGRWRFWLKTSAPHLQALLSAVSHSVRKRVAALLGSRRRRNDTP